VIDQHRQKHEAGGCGAEQHARQGSAHRDAFLCAGEHQRDPVALVEPDEPAEQPDTAEREREEKENGRHQNGPLGRPDERPQPFPHRARECHIDWDRDRDAVHPRGEFAMFADHVPEAVLRHLADEERQQQDHRDFLERA